MSKLSTIQEAATTQTLSRWERERKNIAVQTKGGQRQHDLSNMCPLAITPQKLSSAYANV